MCLSASCGLAPYSVPRLFSTVLLTFWANQAPSPLLIYVMERAIRPVTFPSTLSCSSRPQLCLESFSFLHLSSAAAVPVYLVLSAASYAAEVIKIPELALIQPEESFCLPALASNVWILAIESIAIYQRFIFFPSILNLRVQKITLWLESHIQNACILRKFNSSFIKWQKWAMR